MIIRKDLGSSQSHIYLDWVFEVGFSQQIDFACIAGKSVYPIASHYGKNLIDILIEDEAEVIAPQVFAEDGTRLFNGDVTADGLVNIFDLSFVAARYGSSDTTADINADGTVDIFDLVMIAGKFGQ